MSIRESLEKNQPIIWKTFENGLRRGTLSHAYLLSGEPGTPLLSYAKYLAKTLVCDNPNPLACEECITCQRVEDGSFGDILIIDGSKSTIKKDDVQSIEARFETTTIEKKQIGIYILHLVENMTTEAINALLKFLEEPPKHLFAFLTTENQNRVLPTILSRTQILSFQRLDARKVKEMAIARQVNVEDAELLCRLCNDENWMIEKCQEKEYLSAKEAFLSTMTALQNGVEEAQVDAHLNVLPKLKSKEITRLYMDFLLEALEDAFQMKSSADVILQSYEEQLSVIADIPHLEDALEEGMKVRNQIDFNVQVGLLLDHFFYVWKRGVKKHG